MMYEEDFAIRLAKLRIRKGVSARDMSLSIGQMPDISTILKPARRFPLCPVSFLFVNI